MRRGLFAGLAVLAMAGMLWQNVSPAQACSCAPSTLSQRIAGAEIVMVGVVSDVQFLGPVDEVASEIEPGRGGSDRRISGRLTVKAERYFKGDGGDEVAVEQRATGIFVDYNARVSVRLEGGPNCSLFSGVPIGERYLLFLYRNPESNADALQALTCGTSLKLNSSSILYPGGYQSEDSYRKALAEFDAALGAPPGTLLAFANSPRPDTRSSPTAIVGQTDGPPLLPIAAGAIAIPLAFLLAAAAWPKRRT